MKITATESDSPKQNELRLCYTKRLDKTWTWDCAVFKNKGMFAAFSIHSGFFSFPTKAKAAQNFKLVCQSLGLDSTKKFV